MHRFSRMHLSADIALRTLDTIDLEEKSRVAEGLALLAVIDERKDYLAAGYSCMRNYCMGRLHWSEDRTLRRLQVARAAHDMPELFEYLADGRLSVATAATVVPHLTQANSSVLLPAVAFKSRSEIHQILAAHTHAATPSNSLELDSNVQESSDPHAPGHAISPSVLAMATTCDAAHAPGHASPVRRGRVTSASTGRYEVRLTITAAEHEDLRQAQDLLGHAVPSGDPAEIYARAMKHFLAHRQKQRLGTKPAATPTFVPRGRGIPKALRRLVWERDGRRCSFKGTDGHRCCETRRLEIDHIIPRALGGTTTAENLRLLCRAHNQFEAERLFGKDHMKTKRELAQRARAREKAAARADAERTKAKAEEQTKALDAAVEERRETVHTALRALRYTDAEARHGAALAKDMPGASLEECVRKALAELSRPVLLRGERMARSTG